MIPFSPPRTGARPRASLYTSGNILDVFGIERIDLQELHLAFQVGWRDRGLLLYDLNSYCQFKNFAFDLKADGGLRARRFLLVARGRKDQIAALEAFLRAHPVFAGSQHPTALEMPYHAA